MKIFVAVIVIVACVGDFVHSLPVADIGSDVSIDKVKEDFGKILENLDIKIPDDFQFPPGVKTKELKS